MKNFAKNILLLLISLCFLFSGLELTFRIFRHEDALKLSMGKVDLKYHHSLPPNSNLHLISSVPGEFDVTAHINNYGFRGPNLEVEKKLGQKRIFIVGDSFTFGVGSQDDETIPALMQNSLDPTAQKIQVVNVGRGHYSPLTYYLRLRDEIPKFTPDLIVMMLDFSDLWEDWNGEKNLLYDQSGEIVGSNPYYEYGRFKFWDFLRSKSVLCMYVHNKLIRTVRKIEQLGIQEYVQSRFQGKRAKALIAHQSGDTIEFDGRLFMRGRAKSEEIKRHFERTGKYILMSTALARKENIPFILVMYPYGIYVGPDQWKEGRVFWGFEKNKVDTDYFAFDLVENFSRENKIPFINLLPDFIREKDKTLFFDYDGHFTPEGNRVAAKAILESLIFQEQLAS